MGEKIGEKSRNLITAKKGKYFCRGVNSTLSKENFCIFSLHDCTTTSGLSSSFLFPTCGLKTEGKNSEKEREGETEKAVKINGSCQRKSATKERVNSTLERGKNPDC